MAAAVDAKDLVAEGAEGGEDMGDMGSDADENVKTKLENFKYYTSLILGTLCIVCIFAFLFLVPFVLDPAISTLMHEFVDVPVTCRVSRVDVKHGKSNCTWSSCREGCTSDMYQCYQVKQRYPINAKLGHCVQIWYQKSAEFFMAQKLTI